MSIERQQLSHLRADARWCTFREVAANRVPGSRTIRVFECECGVAIRQVEFEDVAAAGGASETATPNPPGVRVADDR